MQPEYECETCQDDPLVCAKVPGLRHCEKAMREPVDEFRSFDDIGRLPKVIEVDLDFTLCEPMGLREDIETRYGEAEPMKEIIEQLRRAKSLGYIIVIRTARGMLSAKNDPAKMARIKEITLDWLAWHEVPYDEIEFGKRSMCALVDDLAVRPNELEGWLDERTREQFA